MHELEKSIYNYIYNGTPEHIFKSYVSIGGTFLIDEIYTNTLSSIIQRVSITNDIFDDGISPLHIAYIIYLTREELQIHFKKHYNLRSRDNQYTNITMSLLHIICLSDDHIYIKIKRFEMIYKRIKYVEQMMKPSLFCTKSKKQFINSMEI